ncbi:MULTISPECIES: extracellular solute-binding protein [Cohnella]|uniref:extracellular solute-binding protein n=1 Tax=Cohnella TaxID=329857 RepID=UPI0009B9EC2D|nr:extracellular solute-binding protein [Cohnella massiliensis]MBN2980377.1 extracellular solute-binding protein [Cohnella algarum]
MKRVRNHRIASLSSVVVLAMLVLSACGSNNGNSGASSSPASPSASPSASSASSSPAASGEKSFEGQKLVVGVWGGSYAETIEKYVVEPLEAQGATVELVLGGTGDRLAKMYAEKGNPTMDVAFLNLYESKQAIDDGVADPVDPSIPNFSQLYPAAQENGYGMTFMGLGIVYNKDLVTEPIAEWADLWREDLKGKVAFPTYPGFEGDALVAIAGKAFGKTEQDDQANFDKLKELGPVPMSYSNLDELFLEMKNGSVLAAPIFNSYANEYIKKGFPVEFVSPNSPGPVMAKDTIVIAKGTKVPELAKEFVNLAIGVETQEHFATDLFFGPTNKEVTVPDDLAAQIVYGEEAVSKLEVLDWDYIISKRSDWTQKWNTEILAN